MTTLNFSTCNNFPTSKQRFEINTRTFDRNIPSSALQPYINARPVSTKYSIMPIVDPRRPLNVPLQVMPTYNPEKTFNPGNDMGPWSGYATSVNVESDLRNQIFALQKCPQSYFVPDSTSDLYQYSFKNSTNAGQPFPDLFTDPVFNKNNYSDIFNSPQNNMLFYTSSRINAIDSAEENKGPCINNGYPVQPPPSVASHSAT
jgi:hypothetical protein